MDLVQYIGTVNNVSRAHFVRIEFRFLLSGAFIISPFVSRCSINLLCADFEFESKLRGHHKSHIIPHRIVE